MTHSTMLLYVGYDKGVPVLICAPDMDNAMTMVDASTSLTMVGKLFGQFPNSVQGPLSAAAILAAVPYSQTLESFKRHQ